MDDPILVLSRNDIAGLMRPADYLSAVEVGFRAAAAGRAQAPAPMHIPAHAGGFHAKGAAFNDGRRAYAALKFNGNFPGNAAGFGLPTIQGVIVLSDAATGAPLAIIDSAEVTLRRTAAASALAARFLAGPASSSIAVCGCGEQGRAHLDALAEVLPLVDGAVWDMDFGKAQALARYARDSLGLELRPVHSHRQATLNADIVVTCTTAQSPFLAASDVRAGAFIAAVGADAPQKSEIDPALMRAADVFVDVVEQCAAFGDLHHALDAGAVSLEDVCGDLAELATRAKPGRTEAGEIVVLDATGTAIEDAASAAVIYERARERGVGLGVKLV